MCGGTIVANNVTITAAHYVEDVLPGDRFFVRAGSLNATAGGITEYVKNVIIHPDYVKNSTIKTDIVVLILEVEFQFDEQISAIRIANKGKPFYILTEII